MQHSDTCIITSNSLKIECKIIRRRSYSGTAVSAITDNYFSFQSVAQTVQGPL